MEPRYFTHVDTADLLLCDCFVVVGLEVPRIKVPKDRGMAYSVSCYSVRGNPALCW